MRIPKGQSEPVYQRKTYNTMAKRKVQKDKQRSTKHTHKTKNRVTRTPLQKPHIVVLLICAIEGIKCKGNNVTHVKT